VRRDPMAMKPCCGYNYGDYWAHWLSFAKRSEKLPKIFHVNWFRRDSAGPAASRARWESASSSS